MKIDEPFCDLVYLKGESRVVVLGPVLCVKKLTSRRRSAFGFLERYSMMLPLEHQGLMRHGTPSI